jgi:hypothetical protein
LPLGRLIRQHLEVVFHSHNPKVGGSNPPKAASVIPA